MPRKECVAIALGLLASCRKEPLALQEPVAIQLHADSTQTGIDIEFRPPVGFKRVFPMMMEEYWDGEQFNVEITSDPERQRERTMDVPCGVIDDRGGTLEILARTKTERGIQVTCERRDAKGKFWHLRILRLEHNIETLVSCEIEFDERPPKHVRETAEAVCASLNIKGRSFFVPFRDRPKPAAGSSS